MGEIFERYKAACRDDWLAYTQHDFVRQLGEGRLAKASFQFYLQQDYLFLIHFSRAYALAIFKSRTLEDMRSAKSSLDLLLDHEMDLHLRYCAQWGVDRERLLATPEHPANMAYTRYVIERGLAGDLADLHAALAPCVVGYAEVARWLQAQPFTRFAGNPYAQWIETYASEDYQNAARAEVETLDRLCDFSAASRRDAELVATFADATRLEVAFWQMALDGGGAAPPYGEGRSQGITLL